MSDFRHFDDNSYKTGIVNSFGQILLDPIYDPYQINAEGELTPWPEVTDQREMMIHSDSILTIVDPKEEIVTKYLELTA